MRKTPSVLLAIGFVACGAVARAETLDVQERCAWQARRAFQELESENRAEFRPSASIRPGVSDYQSHYNTKLDRCLMLIHRKTFVPLSANLSDQQRQSVLVDANERRYYAIYIESQLAAEPNPRLDTCELIPGMRLKTTCKSREEFDAYVANYIEQ
jgi:hypothetical protein